MVGPDVGALVGPDDDGVFRNARMGKENTWRRGVRGFTPAEKGTAVDTLRVHGRERTKQGLIAVIGLPYTPCVIACRSETLPRALATETRAQSERAETPSNAFAPFA